MLVSAIGKIDSNRANKKKANTFNGEKKSNSDNYLLKNGDANDSKIMKTKKRKTHKKLNVIV